MKTAIEIKNLGFCYGNNSIFKNINLTLESGDFTALIGANGAGKSTLLKLVLGELSPCHGEVQIYGIESHSRKDWSSIGYIPQNVVTSLQNFPTTVEELVTANLYSQIGFMGFLKKQHKEKVQSSLELVGMADYKNRLIGNLSGGQQQRVMLARVLVNDPQLLILDEPTTGVDVEAAKSLYELLSQLNSEKQTTIFIVSHDITRLANYTSKTYCLEEGSLVYLDRNQLETELQHKHKHPENGCNTGCDHGLI